MNEESLKETKNSFNRIYCGVTLPTLKWATIEYFIRLYELGKKDERRD